MHLTAVPCGKMDMSHVVNQLVGCRVNGDMDNRPMDPVFAEGSAVPRTGFEALECTSLVSCKPS